MARNQSEEEKRTFPRIPREVSVEVKKIAYPLQKGGGEIGAVKNITDNGICFSVSRLYPPKTVLRLKINLKGWQHHKRNVSSILDDSAATAPLTTIAEVVWSKKISNDPEYEMGVKFLDIYEDDHHAFKKHLNHLISRLPAE